MSALSRPLRWYWRDNAELFLAEARRMAARELDLRARWRGCRCCGFVFFRFTDLAVATRLAFGHGFILWRPDKCRRCLSWSDLGRRLSRSKFAKLGGVSCLEVSSACGFFRRCRNLERHSSPRAGFAERLG